MARTRRKRGGSCVLAFVFVTLTEPVLVLDLCALQV